MKRQIIVLYKKIYLLWHMGLDNFWAAVTGVDIDLVHKVINTLLEEKFTSFENIIKHLNIRY